MDHTPVSAADLAEIEGLDDWRYQAPSIRTELRAGSFPAAGRLAAEIARAAEAADHHPDIDLRYPDRVIVHLTTHSVGEVTQADIALARTISALAADP